MTKGQHFQLFSYNQMKVRFGMDKRTIGIEKKTESEVELCTTIEHITANIYKI